MAELPTVVGCLQCGHIMTTDRPCEACGIRRMHRRRCKFRRAAAGAVGIECEHGYDVCPICDPCTCREGERGRMR